MFRSRWRTWLRKRTPDVLYYRLDLAVPKARDCGNHEWYRSTEDRDACYHCQVTQPHVDRMSVPDDNVDVSGHGSNE